MAPKYTIAGLALFLSLAADQLSKEWVIRNIPYPVRAGDEVEIIPKFLSITHARNPGAAFSMMNDFHYRMYVFAMFSVIAVVGLGWGLWQLRNDDRLQAAAIGLIMSGALGNAIDRVRFQMVTDMVKVYGGFEPAHTWLINTFHTDVYPIWNIADACILVGVGLFALQYFFEKDKETVGLDAGRAPDPL